MDRTASRPERWKVCGAQSLEGGCPVRGAPCQHLGVGGKSHPRPLPAGSAPGLCAWLLRLAGVLVFPTWKPLLGDRPVELGVENQAGHWR